MTVRSGRGAAPMQLVHPRVVVGAVDDDDLRVGDLPHDARRGLEQMRILVGIVHDAGDGDPVAADLPGDVAVEILRRDDGDRRVGGERAGQGGNRKQQRQCRCGDDFHGYNSRKTKYR